MAFLEHIARASQYEKLDPEDFSARIKINLITNFTDDILKKLLVGANLDRGIYPIVHKTPYKQYQFELKNPSSELYAQKPDITFIFFDEKNKRKNKFLLRLFLLNLFFQITNQNF